MDSTTLAYLAGAMDSDGHFSIKKSTYHRRVRKDAFNAVYSERIGLHQVTPQIPSLLHACFGGSYFLGKGPTPNSRPLYRWQSTDLKAAKACIALLPYLRVKRAQAKVLLELRESKAPGYGQVAYWFVKEFPHWRDMELITSTEAMRMLGYGDRGMLTQAIKNGTIVALPYQIRGREVPRFPRLLVERLQSYRDRNGSMKRRPDELIAWRERLFQEARELNKIGINGTPIYHRTGPYQPIP